MSRRRDLGNLGERWTMSLLESAGFTSVQDLNAIRYNHPGGDFLAERGGERYFITTKARNKLVQGATRLNGGYNVYPEKVRAAAREYGAIPSWLTIQLDTDRRCFTAYFGTIDSLRNPRAVAVPMSLRAVSNYECLAKDRFDQAITSDLSNQLPTATAAPIPANGRSRVFDSNSRSKLKKRYQSRLRIGRSAMASFEDHVAYTEPHIRSVLRELRARINALGRVQEKPTAAQRIAYSVARVFAEVKVQRRRVLVRVFDMGIPDPRGIVTDIPAKHKWQHQKQIAIDSLELVDYAMPFVAASYRSSLTSSPPVPFGRR